MAIRGSLKGFKLGDHGHHQLHLAVVIEVLNLVIRYIARDLLGPPVFGQHQAIPDQVIYLAPVGEADPLYEAPPCEVVLIDDDLHPSVFIQVQHEDPSRNEHPFADGLLVGQRRDALLVEEVVAPPVFARGLEQEVLSIHGEEPEAIGRIESNELLLAIAGDIGDGKAEEGGSPREFQLLASAKGIPLPGELVDRT